MDHSQKTRGKKRVELAVYEYVDVDVDIGSVDCIVESDSAVTNAPTLEIWPILSLFLSGSRFKQLMVAADAAAAAAADAAVEHARLHAIIGHIFLM